MEMTVSGEVATQEPVVIGALEQQLTMLPKDVRFCKTCVVSNQRPRIVFDDEGVCSACRFAYEKYHIIDWQARERELETLLDRHRRHDGRWDVVVACCGGKDSAYVAHQLKTTYGMHPLTVTWAPFRYTDIGRRNFLNFVDAGFSNLTAYPNGRFHRKLARLSFEGLGDAWQPFTYGQVCYAFHVALRLGIKLVFFGENGEAEYGGDPKNNYKPYMPLEDWALLYFKGPTIDKLIELGLKYKPYFKPSDVDPTDLMYYRPPSLDAMGAAGIQMHWYSYYHKWVPQENYYYSVENTGFCANPERSEGTYSKYASLDDRMDGFHFYMAYIKFGIGRTTSDAGHEIRDGHITREEGVALVRRYDGEFPTKYFEEFLSYLNIDEEHFWRVVDAYRQPHLWEKVDGEWKLKHQVS
jgi:N-acetyl sugar amidotransferase